MIDILTLIISCANLVLLLVYPVYMNLMVAQLDEKSSTVKDVVDLANHLHCVLDGRDYGFAKTALSRIKHKYGLDEKVSKLDETAIVYDDSARRHRAHIIATDLIESLDWAVVQAAKITHDQDTDLLFAHKILKKAKEYWGCQ